MKERKKHFLINLTNFLEQKIIVSRYKILGLSLLISIPFIGLFIFLVVVLNNLWIFLEKKDEEVN